MVLLLDTTSKEVLLEGLSIRDTAFVQATLQGKYFHYDGPVQPSHLCHCPILIDDSLLLGV